MNLLIITGCILAAFTIGIFVGKKNAAHRSLPPIGITIMGEQRVSYWVESGGNLELRDTSGTHAPDKNGRIFINALGASGGKYEALVYKP